MSSHISSTSRSTGRHTFPPSTQHSKQFSNTEAESLLIVTCEHGGNRIPADYRHLFNGSQHLLRTHRGYDAGALRFARELSETAKAPLFVCTISRLLVDLNRSLGHSRLYSEFTRYASDAQRRELREQYYLPYRNQVETQIAHAVSHQRRVIHLSCHSFTPELDGKIRNADIGLLYDPAHVLESKLCHYWKKQLHANAAALKVRLNYPYTGTSDGFTSYLRRRFSDTFYLGLELEINQKHVRQTVHWYQLCATIRDAFLNSMRQFDAAQPSFHLQNP
jgi:predicted N-formylglutamate amidohydrolase